MKNWMWLFFLPFIAIGQDKTTAVSLVKSLQTMSDDTTKVNQLHKITLQYIDTDSTKAILYGKKALQLAQKLEWKEGIAISNFQLGSIYSAHYKYDKALLHFNKALTTNNQKLIAKTALNMGCVYTNKSDYPKALDYFHKALKIDEAIGNKKEIAKIAVNMGSVYYGLQKYTKALTYFNQAAKLNTVLGNETDLNKLKL